MTRNMPDLPGQPGLSSPAEPPLLSNAGLATRMPPCAAGRSIVLIGLMGAGKTSIGRRLAARLGLLFRDADAEIELAAGCTIPELFDRYGEADFRAGERRVIRRLLSGEPLVLATGGGAVMDTDTRATIRADAISVWLRVPLSTLVRRVSSRTNRPLLAGAGERGELARRWQRRPHPSRGGRCERS